MSPSSEPRRRRVTAVALGVLLIGGLLAPASAVAAPGADPAPVRDIVAPVLDISFAESDLQGEARVEQLPRKTTITLDSTVLFAKDSARINSRARGRLGDVGERLAQKGPGSVTITGYTDDLGSAAHGKTLSRQRARAVATVLRRDLAKGDYRFTVIGRGEADPAVPNTSEKNRKINRRVVVVYRAR